MYINIGAHFFHSVNRKKEEQKKNACEIAELISSLLKQTILQVYQQTSISSSIQRAHTKTRTHELYNQPQNAN